MANKPQPACYPRRKFKYAERSAAQGGAEPAPAASTERREEPEAAHAA